MTLLAMCVATFMIQLDVTIVNVALPAIQREIGGSPPWEPPPRSR